MRHRPEADDLRKALAFRQSTLDAFSFLQQWGFHLVRSESTLVRYESHDAFIQIYHGRHSYELGVEVGLRVEKNLPENPYSLQEIMSALGVKPWRELRHFWANRPETVRSELEELATLVRTHFRPKLLQDLDLRKRLADFRRVYTAQFE